MGTGVRHQLGVVLCFLRLKPREVKGNAFVAISSVTGSLMMLPILIIYLFSHDFQISNMGNYASPLFISGLPIWLFFRLGYHTCCGIKVS